MQNIVQYVLMYNTLQFSVKYIATITGNDLTYADKKLQNTSSTANI